MQTLAGKIFALLGLIIVCVLTAGTSSAQPQPTVATRIKSPAVVRGFIGGESHDTYVIRAAKGKTLTVRLSWQREDGNRAQFEILDERGYLGVADPVKFGKFSQDEKRWTGRVPKTGNYYIYVVAHPTARYRLRVTLK